jgi:hypothetical protein
VRATLDIGDEGEQRARLRSLRLGARLICGARGADLERALIQAERDVREIPRVLALVDALSALDRRRLLASWAKVL